MDVRSASVADYARLIALDTVAPGEAGRCVQIRDWIDSGCCHVVEVDGAVGAYGVMHYHFFAHGFIEMLMVGEHFRRQGLGIALVRYFKERCATPKLFSSSNLSNQPIQELLKRAGFRASGFIDNLDDNDPEIVFVVMPQAADQVV